MADTKISLLPDGNPPQAGDLLPIARAGTTRRLSISALLAEVDAIIGRPVTGGTTLGILFVDADGNLAQDEGLIFDPATQELTIASLVGVGDRTVKCDATGKLFAV